MRLLTHFVCINLVLDAFCRIENDFHLSIQSSSGEHRQTEQMERCLRARWGCRCAKEKGRAYERRGARENDRENRKRDREEKLERERERFYSTGRGINTTRQVAQKKTINYFYRMEEKQTLGTERRGYVGRFSSLSLSLSLSFDILFPLPFTTFSLLYLPSFDFHDTPFPLQDW